MAFNLTRAVGVLTDKLHARAVTATIRSHLITICRPGDAFRPPRHPATADPLALGDQLAATVHRGDRPTTSNLTTDHQPLRA